MSKDGAAAPLEGVLADGSAQMRSPLFGLSVVLWGPDAPVSWCHQAVQ